MVSFPPVSPPRPYRPPSPHPYAPHAQAISFPIRIRRTQFQTRGRHRSRPDQKPHMTLLHAHSCLVFLSSSDSCLNALVSTSLLWQHSLIVTPLASRTPTPLPAPTHRPRPHPSDRLVKNSSARYLSEETCTLCGFVD